MRIASFIDNQFYLSGVNAYWGALAQALADEGHELVTLVLDSGQQPWNRGLHETWPGQTLRLEYDGTGDDLVRRWKPHLAKLAPDLVIHHYAETGILLSRAARAGRPWLDAYVCHSDDQDHYGRLARHQDLFSHVICVSEVCLNRVAAPPYQYGRDSLSLVEFRFGTPARAARARGAVHVVYAGRLEQYQKRARDLMPLGRLLADAGARLHIAGDGSEEAAIRAGLAAEVAAGQVTFHGYLPEPALFRLMARCHAYLSLSDFEGLSTSLVQAMAHGLVPVVTRTDSGSHFLEHGKNALLFPPGGLEECAAHLALLAAAPRRRAALMTAARRTYQGLFATTSTREQVRAFADRIRARRAA